MIATMQVPEDPKNAARAPWEADPDAWKGEPADEAQSGHETVEDAIERLIGEVAHV